MSEQDAMNIFLDVFDGLPRQGLGSDETTVRAIQLIKDKLSASPLILDVGCGSGMQTHLLNQQLHGTVVAVDYFYQYIHELQENSTPSINCLQGDMNHLPFSNQAFDLIWSEGAIYIIGVDNGLKLWKRLLKSSGYLGFSQLVWLTESPHPDSIEFWKREYPVMPTVGDVQQMIAENGFSTVEHFTIPDADWWTHFYSPLEERLPSMREKYTDNDMAQQIIDGTQQEISIRRRLGNDYGYEFFITQLQ